MLIQWLRSEMFRPYYEQDPGTPSGGTSEAPVSLPTDSGETPDSDDFDKPRALATISKLREFEKTAKAQLKELDALKAEKAQRDEAEMTAAQKHEKRANELQAQLDAAAAQLKRATLKDAVGEAAEKKGLTFAQGALADALALGIFDSLEWDGDKPRGVGEVIKDLTQSRPHWFAAPASPPDIGALERGKPNGKQPDVDKLSRWGIKIGN